VTTAQVTHLSVLSSLQEQFPLREEKFYPAWVQVVCILLSFLPMLWIPMTALTRLLARHRQGQRDAQPDAGPKLQDHRGC
jgi:hypothetical protein